MQGKHSEQVDITCRHAGGTDDCERHPVHSPAITSSSSKGFLRPSALQGTKATLALIMNTRIGAAILSLSALCRPFCTHPSRSTCRKAAERIRGRGSTKPPGVSFAALAPKSLGSDARDVSAWVLRARYPAGIKDLDGPLLDTTAWIAEAPGNTRKDETHTRQSARTNAGVKAAEATRRDCNSISKSNTDKKANA